MSIPKGHKNVSATVDEKTAQRIKRLAERESVSVSVMVARLLSGYATERRKPERMQKVRAGKDELFISLPIAWCRANQIKKGDSIEVDYSTGDVKIRKA